MTGWVQRIATVPTFRSLQHPNYRLFFFGQILSLIGTWMQSMAMSWMVYQLTYSSVWLGTIGFLNSIPILFFSMLGGSLADRMSKHTLIIITQVLSLIQALLLALLVLLNLITIEIVAVLAFTLGTINAFDIPARQSFIVELVGKENLANAIALNSATFNAARIIGPAIGGLVVASVGIGWCFVINAFSFMAVIAGLVMMKIPAYVPKPYGSGIYRSLEESMNYIRSDSSLVALLVLVATVTIFGWSYSVLLPIFADEILNIGAVGLGNLLTAVGIGAFISAVTLASFESRYKARIFIYTGIGIFVVFISLFALSSDVAVSIIALIGVGMGLVMFLATANASIQRRVPDELRGRVMGLYSLIFQGFAPFGSIGVGLLAHEVGARYAVLIGGLVCAFVAFGVRKVTLKIQRTEKMERESAKVND